MEVKPVYLVLIDEDNNGTDSNKYYTLEPHGNEFVAKWGRIGGHESSKTYPMSKWDSTIASKKKKGYVERTDLMTDVIEDSKEEDNNTADEFNVIKNISVREIIKRLWDYANKTIQASYRVSASVVTQAMIDTAQDKIDFLSVNYNSMTVEDFNNKLKEIFVTIPRKMRTVKEYLAKEDSDFQGIIAREQSLLDTMAGQVYKKKDKSVGLKNENQTDSVSILEKMGITMEDATQEDVEKIKKAMGDASNKFYKAWRVTNKATQEAYDKYVSENKIGNVKLTCHGSRNQNWFNILRTGLKIRPAGVILQGNLLGSGLYYSNPDKWHGVAKSIGYTSLGGYWTRDYQGCGFIAFFETALGKSYDIYRHDGKYYNFDLKKLKEADPEAWSLFLHGAGYSSSSTIINDEIVVYNESQTTIKYLVEIR